MRRAILATLLAATLAVPAAAQQSASAAQEAAALRAAQDAEAAGDAATAEARLREVLAAHPSSLSAVLSLERLLRTQGRYQDILPTVERLLAEDPASAIGHQIAMRTLSVLDREDELEKEQARWIAASPDVETPYREAARVWLERAQPTPAIEVLRQGRQRLGGAALAYELGNAYAAADRDDDAVREWLLAIGPEGDGFSLVQRRLLSLPDGGARLTPRIIEGLRRNPTTLARLQGALELSIGAGLEDQSLALAQQLYVLLVPPKRPDFLLTTGRAADAAREPKLAYWAFHLLAEQGALDAPELAGVRRRVAELAVALGERSAGASRADADSVRRVQSALSDVEKTIADGTLDEALAAWADARAGLEDAPELDRIAAALARRARAAGRPDDAARVVQGLRGPESSLVQARLALADGQPADARAAFLAAASGLRGPRATDALSLATMLAGMSGGAARRVAGALDGIESGAADAALDTLAAPSRGLRADERSALLELGARLAEREAMPLRAESLRRVIVNEYPGSMEAPSALLGLARALAQRPADQEEARALLERLILDHPKSALVPQARRLLAELNERVPRS